MRGKIERFIVIAGVFLLVFGLSSTGKVAWAADPAMTSPTPGSTLTSSTVIFNWSAGTGVERYSLGVGTSQSSIAQPPYGDIHYGGTGTSTSKQVTGIPLDGNTVYVRLWWKISGSGWFFADYTYQTQTTTGSVGDGDWTILGTDMYSNVTGNVSIGDMSPDGKFEVNPDGTEDNGDEFVVDSTGNVGIGTTNPVTELDVHGEVIIRNNASASAFELSFFGAAGTDIRSTSQMLIRPGGYLLLMPGDSEVMMLTTDGNVGIGTSTPKQTLTVNGTNNINPSFPDGLFGITPVSQEIPVAGSYTVPVGKNLYVTNVFGFNFGTALNINGVPVVSTTIAASDERTLGMPIIAGAGQVLTDIDIVRFNGFLVDENVTPISNTGVYTVPAGKNLFITNIYHPGGGATIKIDGVPLASSTIGLGKLNMPIIAGAGQVVTSSSSNTVSFNGYLLDQ